MKYQEDEYLMISGIQHFAFCRRQWALIHIEQQWAENLRTVEGNLMHRNVHDRTRTEKRRDVISSSGMAVFSAELGISGSCDLVEFRKSETGITLYGRDGLYEVFPIEYKHGEPKESDADILQLTAQAICLEEMLCCEIPTGEIYYEKIRRRLKVEITDELKTRVRNTFSEMHNYYRRGYTPKVKPSKSCNACSLKELCIPKLCKNISAEEYMNSFLNGGTI